jgi:hypothetical protein
MQQHALEFHDGYFGMSDFDPAAIGLGHNTRKLQTRSIMGQSQSDQDTEQARHAELLKLSEPSIRTVLQRKAAMKSRETTSRMMNREHMVDAWCDDGIGNIKWFKYGLVEVKDSILIPEVQMNGLFATIDFKKGDIIVGYEGKITKPSPEDRMEDTLHDRAFALENKYEGEKYKKCRKSYVIRGYKSSADWKTMRQPLTLTEELKTIQSEVNAAIPDSNHLKRYVNVGCIANDPHNTGKHSNADCISIDRYCIPKYIIDNNTNTMKTSQYLKAIKPQYLVAKLDISKGEEILWKYGKTYWEKIEVNTKNTPSDHKSKKRKLNFVLN